MPKLTRLLTLAGAILLQTSAAALGPAVPRVCAELLTANNLAPAITTLITDGRVDEGVTTAKENAVRAKIVRLLENVLQATTTPGELIGVFNQLNSLSGIGSYGSRQLIGQALRHVDYLRSIRQGFGTLSEADKRQLRQALQRLSTLDGPESVWIPIIEALDLIEHPEHAVEIADRLLNAEGLLLDDFAWHGKLINRTLMISFEDLPPEAWSLTMNHLSKASVEFDSWFKRQTFSNMNEKREAKNKKRRIQFLRTVLMHKEFETLIQLARSIHDSSELKAQFLQALDKYLIRQSPTRPKYSFSDVLHISKALQIEGRTFLGDGDSFELFGSFPNLTANAMTSDIDVMFSGRVEQIVYSQIQGGMYGEGTISSPNDLITAEGKAIQRGLSRMQARAREMFAPTQAPDSEFLSVATLPRSSTRRGTVIWATYGQQMDSFTALGPITVQITNRRLTIRLHDSLASAPESPAKVYNVSVQSDAER